MLFIAIVGDSHLLNFAASCCFNSICIKNVTQLR